MFSPFPAPAPFRYACCREAAAREGGFADWLGLGSRVLQRAQTLFPASSPVRLAPLYVRHNRSSDASLGLAAPVDDVVLASLPAGLGLEGLGEGAPPPELTWASLRDHLSWRDRRAMPVCVLAGSAT